MICRFASNYYLNQAPWMSLSSTFPIGPKILYVRLIQATPELTCSYLYYFYLIILINYLNNNYAYWTMLAIFWLIYPFVI